MSALIFNGSQLSKYFDHTILKPDATIESIRQVANEGLTLDSASVCVNSCHTQLVRDILKGSTVKVCVVVGFPLGAMMTSSKVAETISAIEAGAQEIDMVVNVGYLKSYSIELFRDDIAAVVKACHDRHVLCKAILEMCLLSLEEKIAAINIAIECGVDYIKTSTGFSTGGATIDDVTLMSKAASVKGCKVKASGGIRDGSTAMAMIAAGATRLGTSATVKVIEECKHVITNPPDDHVSSIDEDSSASKRSRNEY